MAHLKLNFQIILAMARRVIFDSALHLYGFLGLFVTVLFLMQWLFNVDQLVSVVTGDSGLNTFERFDFLMDGFFNIFLYANDFVPMSMIVIALLQSAALVFMIESRTIHYRQASPALGLSVLSIGCVACGGSLLTPILALISASGSVALAQIVSRALMVLALVLSYRAVVTSALRLAERTTNSSKSKQVKKP